MQTYSLQTILSTFTNKNAKKLLIFNQAPIGGFHSNIIKLFLLMIPVMEYALFFNPFVFKLLGIATAIVSYIVFLSVVMGIMIFIVIKVKKNTIKKVTPSWEHYFKDISLEMILSSGITPYSKFFQYYAEIIKNKPTEEELYKKLLDSFTRMQSENSELLTAMNRNNKNL